MKKLILFFVLILGFVSEIKAQFPASSEIYYYIRVSDTDGREFYAFRFYTNVVAVQWGHVKPLDLYLVEATTTEYSYDSELSNNRYVVYDNSSRATTSGAFLVYYALSKDKTEMIRWSYNQYSNSMISKHYYKRVTWEELEAMSKSKFDFLE